MEQDPAITPDTTEAQSAEKQKPEYEVMTDSLLDQVDKIPEDELLRRKTAVQDFILDIVDRAEAGEVTSSTGNVYDKDQMLLQFSDYLEESSKANPRAIARIPSFNGMRSAIARLASDERTSRVLADALDEVAHGPWQDRQPAPNAMADIDTGAAEAARAMVAIEDEIDHRTEEIEHAIESEEGEPRITLEEVKEMGGEGVESAERATGITIFADTESEPEVKVPVESTPEGTPAPEEDASEQSSVEADERQRSIELVYERQVESVKEEVSTGLARAINHLDESIGALSSGRNVLVSVTEESVSKLQSVVTNIENYPTESVQTLLRQSIGDLEGIMGMSGRFAEGGISDMVRSIDALTDHLGDQAKAAETYDQAHKDVLLGNVAEENEHTAKDIVSGAQGGLEEHVLPLRSTLAQLETSVIDFQNSAVRVGLVHLEDILRDSYSRPINPDEIQQVVTLIKRHVSEDSELVTSLQKATVGAHSAYEDLRAIRSRVAA